MLDVLPRTVYPCTLTTAVVPPYGSKRCCAVCVVCSKFILRAPTSWYMYSGP
jgi:hypothetical protein